MKLKFYHHLHPGKYFSVVDTNPGKHIRQIVNGLIVEIHAQKARMPEAAKERIINKVKEYQPKTRVIFIDHDCEDVCAVEFCLPDGSSVMVR